MGILLEQSRRIGEETALDDLDRRRTWAELDDRVTRIARLMRDDLRLEPGHHAALLMGNRVEAVEILLGAMLAGIWLTPINYHLKTEEVAYIVADSGSRVLFTDVAHEAEARACTVDELLVAGDELEHAISLASDEPLARDGVPGAAMIYTSGTTGRPKGVMRARARTVAEAFPAAAAAGATLGLDGSGPHLVTGPLYHAAPLLFAVYDMIAGASVVLMPHWDARAALELIETRAVRHTHLVPTMFVRLLRLPDAVRAGFDPASLALVLHGAAPIAPHIKHQMIEWWGQVLVEYWGATECGVCTLVDSRAWLEHPGTVGRPTANFEVYAVDEQGRRLPAGESGTLEVRHRRLLEPFRYHRSPAKTAEAYVGPATFTLGDIGYLDDDGYVYLSDRDSHTIISGGVNIYPAEIEAVLQRHPAVADVAVFGVPDTEWGESVLALVEPAEGWEPSPALATEILARAREHLANYKLPRAIEFESSLPRHPSGKLSKRLLRERYWRKTGRSI